MSHTVEQNLSIAAKSRRVNWVNPGRYILALVAILWAAYIVIYLRADNNILVEQLFHFDDTVAGFGASSLILSTVPNALWMLAMVLIAGRSYIEIARFKIYLSYLALIYAIGLELLQLIHLTDGTYSLEDVITSIIAFIAGTGILRLVKNPYNLKFNSDLILFTFGFLGLLLFNNV